MSLELNFIPFPETIDQGFDNESPGLHLFGNPPIASSFNPPPYLIQTARAKSNSVPPTTSICHYVLRLNDGELLFILSSNHGRHDPLLVSSSPEDVSLVCGWMTWAFVFCSIDRKRTTRDGGTNEPLFIHSKHGEEVFANVLAVTLPFRFVSNESHSIHLNCHTFVRSYVKPRTGTKSTGGRMNKPSINQPRPRRMKCSLIGIN